MSWVWTVKKSFLLQGLNSLSPYNKSFTVDTRFVPSWLMMQLPLLPPPLDGNLSNQHISMFRSAISFAYKRPNSGTHAELSMTCCHLNYSLAMIAGNKLCWWLWISIICIFMHRSLSTHCIPRHCFIQPLANPHTVYLHCFLPLVSKRHISWSMPRLSEIFEGPPWHSSDLPIISSQAHNFSFLLLAFDNVLAISNEV